MQTRSILLLAFIALAAFSSSVVRADDEEVAEEIVRLQVNE